MVKSGPVTKRSSAVAGLCFFGLLVLQAVEGMKRRQMLLKLGHGQTVSEWVPGTCCIRKWPLAR